MSNLTQFLIDWVSAMIVVSVWGGRVWKLITISCQFNYDQWNNKICNWNSHTLAYWIATWINTQYEDNSLHPVTDTVQSDILIEYRVIIEIIN